MEPERDRGFTLVELLIVIVILGVLAAVVLFAVGGIIGSADESACAAELRTLQTAQDVHWALNSAYADEAQLVAAGAVREPSTMYDVTVDGSGDYAIAPAPGSACTLSASGGVSSAGPPPPTTPPPTTPAINPTVVTFHDVSGSYRYRPTSNGEADEIVIFGRAQGQADWVTMINAAPADTAPATYRRVHFVDLDNVSDEGDIAFVMSRARNNGVTHWALFGPDDTASLGAWPSVDAYLSANVGPDAYTVLGGGGSTLSLLQLYP